MKKTVLLVASAICAAAVSGGEFYHFSPGAAKSGDVWVHTDSRGRVRSARSRWGMWPRDAARVGAEIDVDGKTPLLRVTRGFQIDFADWGLEDQSACQSTIYARFRVRIPQKLDKGRIAAVISMQQINNRAGAFLALVEEKGKLRLAVSNGDGKGKVAWRPVAVGEFGKWLDIDVAMDCAARRSAVSLNGAAAVKDNRFRHVDAWEGSMWPRSLKSRDYRCDIKADCADVEIAEIRFSSDPLSAPQK